MGLIAAPDPGWPAAFRAEAARLAPAFGPGAVLHHMGSTSVPDLPAKPVIDILVEVPDARVMPSATQVLASLGYEGLGAFGLPRRHYFRRDVDGVRRQQVHVWPEGDTEVRRHLAFRDLLRHDPAERAGYAAEKRRIMAADPAIAPQAYAAAKSAYVAALERRAVAWTRPVVLRSLEDDSGQRCVDVIRSGISFGWSECRRDPEDSYGWRRLAGLPEFPFASAAEALDDARAHVDWLGQIA